MVSFHQPKLGSAPLAAPLVAAERNDSIEIIPL
jgi:hypothetical protein